MGNAVEPRFHATGARRFHRHAGQIHPYINALNQQVCEMHSVVFHERNASLELRIAGELVDILQDLLARIVGGVRLAGEDNLYWAGSVRHQSAQSLDIAKNEIGALVGCEPTREADGERVGIEQCSRANELHGFHRALRKRTSRFIAHQPHEHMLQAQMRAPQLIVVEQQHLFPERRIVGVSPLRSQLTVKQLHDGIGHPRGEVHAVGDVAHGNAVGGSTRPQRLAQFARDNAVTAGHSVHPSREPNRGGRHVKYARAHLGVISNAHKRVGLDPHLLPHAVAGAPGTGQHITHRELIVSRRHGRVRREHAA